MTARKLAAAACLLALVTPAGAAQPAARSGPTPAARQATEDRALLRQLADAQRGLGEEMVDLQSRVEALRETLAEREDKDDALAEELKAMRDEVKGLYVETNEVKQQIGAVKDDVAAVDANLAAFRTFSGFVIAVMILLLAVVFALSIRR
jgi:septal ring factor EnvC (AmiA/AmiB activator)